MVPEALLLRLLGRSPSALCRRRCGRWSVHSFLSLLRVSNPRPDPKRSGGTGRVFRLAPCYTPKSCRSAHGSVPFALCLPLSERSSTVYTKKSAVFVIDVARVRVLFRLLPRCRARAVWLSLSCGYSALPSSSAGVRFLANEPNVALTYAYKCLISGIRCFSWFSAFWLILSLWADFQLLG